MSLAMLEARLLDPLVRAYRKIPDGPQPVPGENRIVLGGVSWEQFCAIDEERGPDNSRPRLYFPE